jgi:hypothetical protein
MTNHWAQEFAEAWIASWNSHDLDRILSYYADDFEMNSPFIAPLMGEPSSRLRGKEAVRRYWKVALSRSPDMHYELKGVYVGASSVAICYENQIRRPVVAVFFIDEHGVIVSETAHYLAPPGK